MKVSVIVCTRNRARSLERCLEAISAAMREIAPTPAEVIVVDNGSTDDTAACVATFAQSAPVPVRYILEPQKGVSKAKNTGITASAGELLVLTDDDCHLDRNHLRDALRHDAADAQPVFRGGRVELGDPTDLPLTIKTENAARRWSRERRSARTENIGNSVLGCNLAFRRTLASKVGGFDERLGPGKYIPASEDTDYTLRAYLAGFEIEYVPDMIVRHFHGRKTQEEGFNLVRNYIKGNGALLAKYAFVHPDFCRQYWWDAKALVKEFFQKTKFKIHGAEFYRGDMFKYTGVGILMYLRVLATGKS